MEKKNNLSKEIFEKIISSNKIFLSLHDGPDGDSLGSCVAMKYFLQSLGKEVDLISFEELPEELTKFEFIKEINFLENESINLSNYDLFISLDTGSINNLSHLKIPKNLFIINIDHHATNNYFGNLNYVDERPSASSVLIDLFKKWNFGFDEKIAEPLLVALYTDTGGLVHGKKGEALKDAVFLSDKGADYSSIANKIEYNIPLKRKKYFALLTNKFKIVNFEKYNIGISSVSKKELKEFDLSLADVRGGPNYLQEIGGVDFLFTLAEMNDFIKGSLRSKKGIDVSLIAKELGGGGHKLAAAFKLENIDLRDAEKKVFEAIKKVGIHKID